MNGKLEGSLRSGHEVAGCPECFLRKCRELLRLYCVLRTTACDKAETDHQPQDNCDVNRKFPGHPRNTQIRSHRGISGTDDEYRLTCVQKFDASDQRRKHPALSS